MWECFISLWCGCVYVVVKVCGCTTMCAPTVRPLQSEGETRHFQPELSPEGRKKRKGMAHRNLLMSVWHLGTGQWYKFVATKQDSLSKGREYGRCFEFSSGKFCIVLVVEDAQDATAAMEYLPQRNAWNWICIKICPPSCMAMNAIAFLWQVWRTMICVKWYAIEIIHFPQPTYCTPFLAENASKLGASKLLHGINKQQDDGLLTTINSS